jgi:transposase
MYKQILSIAYFLVLEDNNPLSRFPKWSKLHTHPHGETITSQRSSDLFAEINEGARMKFFRFQAKRRAENEYWAYDTTSISSYSELLRQVSFGKNKDHEKLPQINLALLYGQTSRIPFYYRKLAGKISDVSTIKQLLRDMDFMNCKKIKLVMDRGFYREQNINDLLTERLKFLIGVKLSLKYVRKELDAYRETIREWTNFMPEKEAYGLTIPIWWKHTQVRPYKKDEVIERRRMYLHLYFDPIKALEDERAFTKLISRLFIELETGNRENANEELYAKYFDIKTTPIRGQKIIPKEQAIAAAKKDFGYFALLSNTRLTPEFALDTYRNKDVAEKAFDNVKDRLDMRRLNVSSDLSLDGKLFVMFVALILISFIHNAMKQAKLYAKYTMQELLDELEMIERFERQGYKPQLGEITVKQRDLYIALNLPLPKSSLC